MHRCETIIHSYTIAGTLTVASVTSFVAFLGSCLRRGGSSGDSPSTIDIKCTDASLDGFVIADGEVHASRNDISALRLGDNGDNQQIGFIISCDVGSLSGTVTAATVKVKYGRKFNANPINSWGSAVVVDVSHAFSGDPELQASDLSVAVPASDTDVGQNVAFKGGFLTAELASSALSSVSGRVQLRFRMATPSNNNGRPDSAAFFSGASPGTAPVLTVEVAA